MKNSNKTAIVAVICFASSFFLVDFQHRPVLQYVLALLCFFAGVAASYACGKADEQEKNDDDDFMRYSY